jgi:hypothetical protein
MTPKALQSPWINVRLQPPDQATKANALARTSPERAIESAQGAPVAGNWPKNQVVVPWTMAMD